MKEQFSHASPVFPVKDISRSIQFYRDKLGFKVNFRWGNPIDYAVLARGDVKLHLTKRDDSMMPSDRHTALYIFVHDVDAVYTEFHRKGVPDITQPKDQDYKMRDFDLVDPDGYRITFGKGE